MARMEASATEASPAGRSSRGTRRWAAFGAIALAVVLVDQLSKAWVDASFALASVRPVPGQPEPTPVLGDLVRIAKSYNDGGIFGLFGASAPILATGSIAVIALIVVYQWREGVKGHPWLSGALGLLLGGAIGNLIDRVRLGYVIDFVDMGVGSLRWFTFNVADAAISVSIVALLVVGFLGDRRPRR
jgi:signal peptidase II